MPRVLPLVSRMEGEGENSTWSSCVLARELESVLYVVVLQLGSRLQEEMQWLETGEKLLLFSTFTTVPEAVPVCGG